MHRIRSLVWLLCAALTVSAGATTPTTRKECLEARDFIENAARSRDNGYSREFMLRRFEDDVIILSGMDPEKRWFIRSPAATRFLREALTEVFAKKKKPQDHGSAFLESCVVNLLMISPDDL